MLNSRGQKIVRTDLMYLSYLHFKGILQLVIYCCDTVSIEIGIKRRPPNFECSVLIQECNKNPRMLIFYSPFCIPTSNGKVYLLVILTGHAFSIWANPGSLEYTFQDNMKLDQKENILFFPHQLHKSLQSVFFLSSSFGSK